MEAHPQGLRSWKPTMADFLDLLVKNTLETLKSGYYKTHFVKHISEGRLSLRSSIINCKHAPIIAEIKPASPSSGVLREISSINEIAKAVERGGAVGISVLTEPKYFRGSLKALAEAKKHVNIPVLMKDIVVDPVQIEAAATLGADAVLLILSIFERGCANSSLEKMIEHAHSRGLEVLLETHSRSEFLKATGTDADLVGINNRDLKTLNVNLDITRRVMSKADRHEKIVVSESGIHTPDDVRFLHSCGTKAFLVGSALMRAENVKEKVRELVTAL